MDKITKNCDFSLRIFKDQATRDAAKTDDSIKPVGTMRINCTDETIFDARFSPAAIAADKDQYHQAYEYLEVDYKDEEGELILGDWESDE